LKKSLEPNTVHPCTQYALEAVQGLRVVGQTERMVCQRHLDDLDRQGTQAFPWVFDEEKANRIYRWFKYCKHVKGPLANTPIELLPFQKFDLGCIFGWVHMDSGLRRFDKAYIQEARKNAKSTMVGGIALYLMCADHEESPEVYCAAVDKDQARIVYKIAKAMAQKSPDIRKQLRIRNYEISHITRGGEMSPFSKDLQNKDGYNPSGAIIDEYHAHKTSEIHDLIWSAWGAREQALLLIITTAGMDAEKSPCYLEYSECKKMLAKSMPMNEKYFIMIRELDKGDDEHDSKNWIKANPLRAATPEGLARLQTQHDVAFNTKNSSKIRAFRIKNLDIWVYESENSYIGELITKWDDLAVIPPSKDPGKSSPTAKELREKFAELTKGYPCILGVDLSKKVDLTADGFVFLLPGEKVAVCAHGFIPEGAVVQHEATDNVPYRDWIREGWITETEGEVTDQDEITGHMNDMEFENQWKIHEIGFDPYQALHWANERQDDGYTCVEIRQGVQTLSEPTKLFRDMVASGDLIHDGSPALKWCLINAKEVIDRNGNILLSKKNPNDSQRIDLLAAIMNALVRLAALKAMASNDLSDTILSDEWGGM